MPITLSFPDQTYSVSNKPSTATLKTDLQNIETAFNALETSAVTATADNTFTGINIFTGATIAKLNAPQGYLINGKISVTVASNNITLTLETLDGNTPSATNPVYCRIGDTVRSITSALSVTKNAGTNWFNAGSSELATKEIDYFVYLGYNATDGVTIGFSRIPSATQYGDFSATTTNEKYCAISTITNAASTDYYENVGRFAATLSAGAGYTWSVPTYTAINLIQRPIYESRWNTTKSVLAGFSAITSETIAYKLIGNAMMIESVGNLGGTSNATTFTLTLPFTAGSTVGTKNLMSSNSGDAGSTLSAPSFLGITSGSASVTVGKTMANTAGGGFTGSSTKWVTLSGMIIQI